MKILYLDEVVSTLLAANAHTAIKYVSPEHCVRVTRKLVCGRVDARYGTNLIVTVGEPNFLERRFIRQCQKAGEHFPVKKIQLKFPPKKRIKVKSKKRRKK